MYGNKYMFSNPFGTGTPRKTNNHEIRFYMYNWGIYKLIWIEKGMQVTEQRHNRMTLRTKWSKRYGIKCDIKWKNKIIFYSTVFDSTKGYPGEGPDTNRRGKKQECTTDRGDKRWFNSLKTWGGIPTIHLRSVGQENTEGHDLWYENKPSIKWTNLQSNIVSINMAGWGEQLDRKVIWANMAKTRTVAAVLVDHRRNSEQQGSMEYEIEETWLGERTGCKAAWTHTPGNKHIGGISIALHPALARYAKHDDEWYDPRGWGRWTTITVIGRKRKIAIIGTYGPTPNKDEEAVYAMWQRQLRAMQNIPNHERATDPREQYINDMRKMITQLKDKNFQIIMAGDMNININRDTKETRQWKDMAREAGLENTMQIWWPNISHKMITWGKKSWIDHIYMSNALIREGGLCKAGIEKGHTFYKSDHNMVGAEINWTRILGRITSLTEIFRPRQRVVKASIAESKEHYNQIATRRAKKQEDNGGNMSDRAAALLTEAQRIGRGGNVSDRNQLQKKMDALMAWVINELLAIEAEITQSTNTKTNKHFRGGRNKKHCWSDVFGRKIGISYLLDSMIKCCTQKKKRKHVGNLIQTIKKTQYRSKCGHTYGNG